MAGRPGTGIDGLQQHPTCFRSSGPPRKICDEGPKTWTRNGSGGALVSVETAVEGLPLLGHLTQEGGGLEPVAELGTHLKLPPWLEKNRPAIEQRLPEIELKPVAPATL